MRTINKIVVHTSATPPDIDIGADEIREWHLEKGWDDIGYHYVIRRNGNGENGRPEEIPGAHVAGHNHDSIGVCLVGGVDDEGNATANYTFRQYEALHRLLKTLTAAYPDAEVVGHRDLSPDADGSGEVERDEWLKDCPCFDVREFLL